MQLLQQYGRICCTWEQLIQQFSMSQEGLVKQLINAYDVSLGILQQYESLFCDCCNNLRLVATCLKCF